VKFTAARAQIMKAIDEYDEGRLTRSSLEQVVTATLREVSADTFDNDDDIIDDEQYEVEIIDDTPLDDLDEDASDWRSDT
jgi:hypothetical protein